MAKEEAIPIDVYATGEVDLHATRSTKVGAGRYSLRRIIGRGGMGIVWLAYDERLQTEVALKFLPPQIRFDSPALDDLRRETARTQKLSHPNIIRIHDLNETQGEDPFICMEYVDGCHLGTVRVQQPSRVLTWAFVQPLLQQLCDALEYAHGQGIVHRDLKPPNMMVDQAGKLKLADFGIARTVNDTMTYTSITRTSGTLLYMSPQQLDGGLPKVTDDIYALGATAYELLTSKPPFYSGDLLHQVRSSMPARMQERLRELNLINDVPRHVEECILACLSKIEAHRPQSAREVAHWLTTGERPVSVTRVLKVKPQRRRLPAAFYRPTPWYVGGAAAVMGMLAAGFVVTYNARQSTNVAARSLPADNAAVAAASPQAGKTASLPQPTRVGGGTILIVTNPSSGASKPSPRPVGGAGSAELVAARSVSAKPPLPIAALPKQNAPTALELARRGNTHVSERSKNKIVEILSSRTPLDVPPPNWRVVYYDPRATYKAVEVQFEDGLMARIYEPTRLLEFLTPQSQQPIELDKLKIDSNDALRIALGLPSVRDIAPRTVEFGLDKGYGGLPVWRVRLYGALSPDRSEDIALGYALIAADDGKVLKESFKRRTP